MRTLATIILGKIIILLTRLRGGGSALPGLVAEKLHPRLTANLLGSLEKGVIVISGTNGKTTTAKIVSKLLTASGLKVLSNQSGSNFSRGITAELLKQTSLIGRLDADIAVLELDEAHGVLFANQVSPDFCLLLNISPDQTDRFASLDAVAELLDKIANKTKRAVVLNAGDERLLGIGRALADNITANYFTASSQSSEITGSLVTLTRYDNQLASFLINGKTYQTHLALSGRHNAENAAAALALVLTVLGPQAKPEPLLAALSQVTPAFGRGEVFQVGQTQLELILVKNQASFQSNLQTFVNSPAVTMIAINDKFADGRDISWLQEVDFSSLKSDGVDVVSGIRAEDAQHFLASQGVTAASTEADLMFALKSFTANNQESPLRIYASYTAMLVIRRWLTTSSSS